MTQREKLTRIWPYFGLKITTSRLILQLPLEQDIADLAQVARSGIQPEGSTRFQQDWLYDKFPDMERELFRRFWTRQLEWEPGKWQLKFAVYLESRPIGLQDLWAKDFTVARSVESGSWLGLKYQNKGYGTEMRAAVLELAFGHLGALEARSDYLDGNSQSAKVSSKLGYTNNGQQYEEKNGKRVIKHMIRLSRDDWERYQISGTMIAGLEPCRNLLGLE